MKFLAEWVTPDGEHRMAVRLAPDERQPSGFWRAVPAEQEFVSDQFIMIGSFNEKLINE